MKYVLSLLVLISLLVAPVSLLAQDDGTTEWTSEDELFSLLLPEGWAAAPAEDVPGVYIGNSEDVLGVLLDGDTDGPPQAGQLAINIMVLPAEFMDLMGIDMEAESLLGAFVEAFLDSEDVDELGDAKVLALEDGPVVETILVQDDEGDGAVLLRYDEEAGIIYFGIAITAVDGYNDAVEADVLDVFVSFAYNGTADELMAMLMGTDDEDSTTDGDSSTDMDGATSLAFDSGISFSFGDEWSVLSEEDFLVVLSDASYMNYIQIYDLGALFEGADLGMEFMLETYGNTAAETWGDADFSLDSFEMTEINGFEAGVYGFEGEQDGTSVTVQIVLLNLEDGNYVLVQGYSLAEMDGFVEAVMGVAESVTME